MTGTATRLWALRPATYRSPAQVQELGDAAPWKPFPVYLIEHRDGYVLFDSGLDPDFADDPVGGYGPVAERIEIQFASEHLIEPQLRELGVEVEDVATVIASHLHFDHAGGLKQFPHARTIIGAGEMAYARAPEKFSTSWFRHEDFRDRHGINWFEIPCDHDLFGDGAVTALYMPGHSPGSLAALVRLPSRTLVLSGDVVHTHEGFDSEFHYFGDVDSVAARASLRKLRHVMWKNDAELWICHDPGDWEYFGGAGEKQ